MLTHIFIFSFCRYEAVFYGALALVLMGWILVECAILSSTENQESPCYVENLDDKLGGSKDGRSLELSHLRIPLTFVSYFDVILYGTV